MCNFDAYLERDLNDYYDQQLRYEQLAEHVAEMSLTQLDDYLESRDGWDEYKAYYRSKEEAVLDLMLHEEE